MRRELTEQAEAMARQRVQHLGEELRNAGLLPPESEDDVVPVALVKAPGRHARTRVGPGALPRIVERLSERLPFAVPHLTVLVAVAAVVLVVIAWVRISASSEAVPVPQAHTSRPFPTATSSTSPSPAGREVVVDVAGKVRRPGVVTLPVGSRVIDAIRRAGGAQGAADLSSVNLARVLVDGEQILVGRSPVPAAGTAGAGPATGGSSGSGGQVSLNQASLEQLEGLPGVGPVTAQKIIDWRTEHGAFSSLDELLDVDGIGDKTLAELTPHLTL